jgi:putative cell wall-binding protein
MNRRIPSVVAPLVGATLLAIGLGVASPAAAASPVQRIGGADRYEVSAAISADTFTGMDPVPIAYVVSGEVFADALSASALAGLRGGPVLLTTKTSVPGVIKTELSRIDPVKIVVLGGPATIDDAVLQDLRRFSPTVTRIGGADRFEVSSGAARDYYSATVPRPAVGTAFVAAGANFPDALSGSAAAGHLNGPVLLTRKEQVPASVLTELKDEKPGQVRVLGGTSSVDDSVVSAITSGVSMNTSRVSGTDRFAVSAKVSETSFSTTTKGTVYIASGEVFPDALSGGAAAIVKESPVLLVTRTSIPGVIADELQRLKPTKIVVLGGENTIDETVVAQLGGYIVAP